MFAICSVLSTMASPAHAACSSGQQWCPSAGGCIPLTDLCILEPVPGGTTHISAGDVANLGAFLIYVNGGVWQWALMIGVAIAVLNGTIAGFMIVTSNGDSARIGEAKTKFMWSAIGLLILLLAGIILNFINPIGFGAP
jgi:hypothetical protein